MFYYYYQEAGTEEARGRIYEGTRGEKTAEARRETNKNCKES